MGDMVARVSTWLRACVTLNNKSSHSAIFYRNHTRTVNARSGMLAAA